MKTSKLVISVIALSAGLLASQAADKRHLAGPRGGRLLEKTVPQAEFFLEKDHSVTIAVYDAALKPVPVADQVVTVIADRKGEKQKIEFEKKGDLLVSRGNLPEGEGYNLVVQFKEKLNAKPQNFRFKLDTHICQTCKRAEYACICDE